MRGVERAGPDGIAYERHGSGPPVVLIHGLGATRRIWAPQIELLAGMREVIALDMPGFGDSAPLATTPTPAVLGTATIAMLAELGLDRPHLVGNSLGGWVALEMAKAGAAASVCLISPAGLWRRPLGPRRADARRWGRRLRPLVGLATRSARLRGAMLRSTVGHPERIPPREARGLIGAWLDAPGYDAANDEMRRGICEDLDRVRVPTTVAWGELDGLVGPPKPERRPPGSRFLKLAGCGHTPNWDAPETIAELILETSSTPSHVPTG